MSENEVHEIVNKMKNGFTYHRFNEPGVTEEYIKKLAKLNYQRMKQVVDELIEENSREVPPISLLLQRYKGIGKNNTRTEIRNEKYCPTCHDRGFVLLKEQVKIGEDKEGNTVHLTYEFAYYCPFCTMGSQYEYDGRQCKEWKTDYVVKPITEVLPEDILNDIRKENLKWKQQNEKSRTERTKTRSLKDITGNIGKDIPEAKHYMDADFEPGDAYEEEGLPV